MLPSLEAINFQLNHQLPRQLDALFTSYKKEIFDYNSTHDIIGINNTRKQRSELKEIFINDYVPKLIKIIKTTTGIIVERVIVSDIFQVGSVFAVDLINPSYDIALLKNRIAGTSKNKIPNNINDIIAFSKKFDLVKGKISESKLNIHQFSINLYFDLGTAFFINDIYPNVPELKTEELTAILCHEIGHPMSIIEHCADIIHFSTTTSTNINYVVNNTDLLSEDSSTALLKLVQESDFIPKETKSKLEENIKQLFLVIKKKNNYSSKILMILSIIIQLLVIKFIYGFISKKIGFMLSIVLVSGSFGIFNLIKLKKDKSSQDAYSKRNEYRIEQLADEYVTRLGYGSYLVTALNKLNIISNTNTLVPFGAFDNAIKDSYVIKCMLSTIQKVAETFSIYQYDIYNTYEDDLSRIKKLLQNNRVIFKNQELSKEISYHFLKENDKLELLIDKEISNRSKTISKFLWTYLALISAPTNIANIIANGNLSKDMEKLLNEIDEITNSKLYVQAAKLKNLV